MSTHLEFYMMLKSGRHVFVAGQFVPSCPASGPYPGDPPERADIELSTCQSTSCGCEYDPTEEEMFEIIERAEDVYFQGMRNDIHEMDEFGKK